MARLHVCRDRSPGGISSCLTSNSQHLSLTQEAVRIEKCHVLRFTTVPGAEIVGLAIGTIALATLVNYLHRVVRLLRTRQELDL